MRFHAAITATLLTAAIVTTPVTPAAHAACDISQTKCALNGGKCNIKFRNQTGISSGSDSGTDIIQESSAQTVKVKALKDNGDKAGNALTIAAGASNTMNVDKKANKNFAKIRITSMSTVEGVTMGCSEVQDVLNGNGTCKVFYGYGASGNSHTDFRLGYNCDGGNVVGPEEE